MKKLVEIIFNLVAAILMGWSGVVAFALAPFSTQAWILAALGVVAFVAALHFVIEAVRIKIS